MGKFKLMWTDFDQEKGTSTACVSYKNHLYFGKAYYNKDDLNAPPVSSFEGCRIAEMRACAKALKVELKEKEKEYRLFSKVACELGVPYSQIEKKLRAYDKDIKHRQQIIISIYDAINKNINEYYSFHEKRKKKET